MTALWAADPTGRHQLRYWDGQAWTEFVADNGTTDSDPLEPVEAPWWNGATEAGAATPGPSTPAQWTAAPPGPTAPPYPGSPNPGHAGALAPGYQVAVPSRAGKTDGRLVAAGVMTVIVAALGLIVGLWLFSVTTSDVGGLADELSGGSLTFSALFTLALSGTWLTVGINCARGRDWARITVIVGNAIVLLLVLMGAASGDSDAGGILFFLGWCGTIVALAATGKATPRSA